MYSTDGTGEILERYRSSAFRVVKVANADAGDTWLRINEAAIRALECDYVVFLDADEFPLPATGSLRSVLASARADLIQLPRFNVALRGGQPALPASLKPPHYSKIDLYVKPLANAREHFLNNPDHPWIRTVPMPRIAIRPEIVAALKQGMHNVVVHPGMRAVRARSHDIVVAHLALSTMERLARKVESMREYLRHHGNGDSRIAWHWRRWVELADRGALEAEFQNSVLDAAGFRHLKREGVVKNAAEVLSESIAAED
jgi:glycosyltransferase involved in cell wall biosynthesis